MIDIIKLKDNIRNICSDTVVSIERLNSGFFNETLKNNVFENENILLDYYITPIKYDSSGNANKWEVFTSVYYKQLNIGKKSSIKTVSKYCDITPQILKALLYEVITCSVEYLNELVISENGYVLEVTKMSNKYVTILEHINGIPFEKRFNSVFKLCNYIEYRINFHNNVNIKTTVSISEYQRILNNIKTLKENKETLFYGLCENLDIKNNDIFYINKIKRGFSQNSFNIHLNGVILNCDLSDIKGLCVRFDELYFHGDKIKTYKRILFILDEINNKYLGHLSRYIRLSLQSEIFESKIEKIVPLVGVIQKKYDDISKNIKDAIDDAFNNNKMNSDFIKLTDFNGYQRSIYLDGVLKNRRQCLLKVIVKTPWEEFCEFQLKVEKNRILEESNNFLKNYFC